jgi:hypothetical protein
MSAGSAFAIFDEYDRWARLVPATMTLAPLIALVFIWWPALWTVATGLGAAGLSAAPLVLLALYVASLGDQLEENWRDDIGTPHSARLLSHRDTRLGAQEKEDIHRFLANHGRPVPTAEAEDADDGESQKTRISRVKWMITISRPEAGRSLLLKQNIGYGFWRNLRALRPFAIGLAATILAFDAYLLWRTSQSDGRFVPGVALATGCILLAAFHFSAVRRTRVIRASQAYADRLFALRDDPEVIKLARASPPPAALATSSNGGGAQ